MILLLFYILSLASPGVCKFILPAGALPPPDILPGSSED